MKIFYENLIDAAGVVFTATSEVSTLPARNLAHEFRKKVWRTGSVNATERVVIDLGSAQGVTAIILLDHTLTNSDTNILLEANSSDSWGAPAFSQALTWINGGTIGQTFTLQTFRYWRLSFTKSSATESRDIGRLFLGTAHATSLQPDFDGYDDELQDLSRKQQTLSGQTYTEIGDKRSLVRCDFSRCPNDQVDNFRSIVATVGEAVAFFVQVDTVAPLDKFWYLKFRRAFKRKVSGFDNSLYWDLTLEMEEQL